jgi:putative membrane protein
MTSSRLAVASVLCGLLAACGSSTTPNLQSSVSSVDSAFVTGATQASDAEIGAAKIALTKSQNTDVIAFANEMITQHTEEKTALAPIATSVGVGLPTGVNAMQAATAATLQATAEPAFDALYINSEIAGHTSNIDKNYSPEIASGTAAPLVAYAKKYLPQVQMHLSMAQTIKAKYGF